VQPFSSYSIVQHRFTGGHLAGLQLDDRTVTSAVERRSTSRQVHTMLSATRDGSQRMCIEQLSCNIH
jgi:hypothetical protein